VDKPPTDVHCVCAVTPVRLACYDARHLMPKRAKRSIPKPRLPHVVCKPCWELKYCPYGPLVEYFPLVGEGLPLRQVKKSHRSWLEAVRAGSLKTETEIYRAIEGLLCLEPKRWAWIEQYRTEELRCMIFGHICPVFFSAETITETREDRKVTRTVSREIMLKVVRRDGQMCRVCGNNVRDDEIEFDHVIPKSRGGPSSAENLRVLCRSCNRAKRFLPGIRSSAYVAGRRRLRATAGSSNRS